MTRTGRGSTRPGVSAALPSDAYAPASVHQADGGSPTVEFEGEDHRRRTFNFAECPLPGWHDVLAQVLAQRVGASGQLRTSSSSLTAWNNLRRFLRFLAALADPPQLPSELTVAHVNAFTAGETSRLGTVYGPTTADHIWRLLRLQPAAGIVDQTAINALRIRSAGTPTDSTPGYSDRELASILHAARGDVVKLRTRLNAAEEILQRFQAAAEQLTVTERTEGLRLSEMAAIGLAAPDEQGRNGYFQRQRLAEPLFVTRRDVAPLLVLLVAVTGRDVETIKELPAQHQVLDGRAVEVRLTKRRSGDGKWFQTATWEIGPPGRELHHPGGLYLLLHQMMARGRTLSADPSSFWAVWRNLRRGRDATVNEIGNPFAAALTAGIEVRQWGIDRHGLRGDDEQPLPVTFRRLRTSVEVRRTRTLGGHLPSAARSNTAAVLFRNYLRADPVAREWAQEVTGEAIGAAERAALDAHRQSLARPAAPTVGQRPPTNKAPSAGHDGPWSDCKDPAEHPATGRACRSSFLDCFHCGNCLIDRSHLPRLVALLGELDQRRQLMTEEQWWARYGPVAVVALRTTGLRQVVVDDTTVALRLLVDRRDQLGRTRTEVVSRLHHLLLELVPGGAKKFLSAQQARAMLNTVRPRDVVGKTRRWLASELIHELVTIDKKIKIANQELTDLVDSTGSRLQQLHGIGPSGAARLLGDIGDVGRFASRAHFASWNGTAPIDASSGDQNRHRLSRAGNRRINRALHIMAIVQLRHDTEGRRYYRRKLAAGKTPMEALRALKRRLSDVVYKQMVADAKRLETGPGGHLGATLKSSAADPIPMAGTSDKSLPGPATPQPKTFLMINT